MTIRKSSSTSVVLAARAKTHGNFGSHSVYAQAMKKAMRLSPKWEALPDDMKESLEMIQHKIARILNGNSAHKDHWVDIAGYAELVARRLENVNEA